MRSIQCPNCDTVVQWQEGTPPRCTACGYAGKTQTVEPWPASDGHRQPTAPSPEAPSETIAIVALLLNLLVLPGVGTLVGGRTNEGIAQMLMMLFGFVLLLVFVGIFLLIAAWIWGLVSGIQILQEAQQAKAGTQTIKAPYH